MFDTTKGGLLALIVYMLYDMPSFYIKGNLVTLRKGFGRMPINVLEAIETTRHLLNFFNSYVLQHVWLHDSWLS